LAKERFGADFIDGPISPQPGDIVGDTLTATAVGPLTERVEGVAKILVDHPNLEKLTNLFSRGEATMYAKMRYLEELVKAVADEDEKGFIFPDFEQYLINPDYQLRTSVKQGTRKILESITKIFERGGEGRRGILNRGR
jgi:hypothetical protein